MRKRALSAASAALLRRSTFAAAGCEGSASSTFSAPLTARNSLVASTSGRTTTAAESSEQFFRRSSSSCLASSTSALSLLSSPASAARSIHFCVRREQGALPESAPRPDERPSSSMNTSLSSSSFPAPASAAATEPKPTTKTTIAIALDPATAAAAAADPFSLVAPEVEALSQRLRECVVATAVPVLSTAAEYFFRAGSTGKRLRPTLVLLMAGATAPPLGYKATSPPSSSSSSSTSSEDDALPPRPSSTPFFPAPTRDDALVDTRPPSSPPPNPRRAAQRLAEIAELIHVASLLHDDVIDDAALRRGLAAVNAVLGNKVSVLAGDFLLARASVSLASLRDHGVTLLMSRVIEDLVAGEVAQMSARGDDLVSLESYERRCFLKTASLMSRSSQAAALLSGADSHAAELAARYGESLGLAFQVTDDALDYDLGSSALSLGKPAAADAKAGVVTAPPLLAMMDTGEGGRTKDAEELEALVRRRFKQKGDPARAAELVRLGRGCEKARELAARHADEAVNALRQLPPPAHEHGAACRVALEALARAVVQRKK